MIAGELVGFIATKEIEDETTLCNFLKSKMPSDVFTIQENIRSIEFIKGVPVASNLLEKGRSFSKDIEIRWLKVNGGFHLVAFSEDSKLLEGLELSDESYLAKAVSYFLWGEYKPDLKTFIEVRIPRPINYPVSAGREKGRLRIIAYNYLKDEIIQFTRYRNVIYQQ